MKSIILVLLVCYSVLTFAKENQYKVYSEIIINDEVAMTPTVIVMANKSAEISQKSEDGSEQIILKLKVIENTKKFSLMSDVIASYSIKVKKLNSEHNLTGIGYLDIGQEKAVISGGFKQRQITTSPNGEDVVKNKSSMISVSSKVLDY